MNDKFGDYGVISLIVLKIEKSKYTIFDFLLSCRVFEREIEPVIFKYLHDHKLLKNKHGCIRINRNKKNSYVQKLFDNYKFIKKINTQNYKINGKINSNKDISIT